jgi:hypothetical protein
MKRKHSRIYDERAGAVATLQREVDKRRKALGATIDYPLTETTPRGAKKSKRR